jgi:hypothetical protein
MLNINAYLERGIVLGLFQEKIPGGVGTPSIIWGTTTRILIIFGIPPHKYKRFMVLRHFQQYFNYIVAVSFIGGGNRSTRRIIPNK